MTLCMNQEVLLADGTCLDINDLVLDACLNVDCGPDGMCQNGQCCAFEIMGSCITTPSCGSTACGALNHTVCLKGAGESEFFCCDESTEIVFDCQN